MQWQIGLAGDCLFSGGRLGDGSGLLCGKRFPWDFLADEPCADSTRRLHVLRACGLPTERASCEGRTNCRRDGRASFAAWSKRRGWNVLPLGGWSQRHFVERSSSNCIRFIFKKGEQTFSRLELFAILLNDLFTRMANAVILLLSRLARYKKRT